MNLETKDTRNIRVVRLLRFQIAIRHEEQVRKGCAKVCTINVSYVNEKGLSIELTFKNFILGHPAITYLGTLNVGNKYQRISGRRSSRCSYELRLFDQREDTAARYRTREDTVQSQHFYTSPALRSSP